MLVPNSREPNLETRAAGAAFFQDSRKRRFSIRTCDGGNTDVIELWRSLSSLSTRPTATLAKLRCSKFRSRERVRLEDAIRPSRRTSARSARPVHGARSSSSPLSLRVRQVRVRPQAAAPQIDLPSSVSPVSSRQARRPGELGGLANKPRRRPRMQAEPVELSQFFLASSGVRSFIEDFTLLQATSRC